MGGRSQGKAEVWGSLGKGSKGGRQCHSSKQSAKLGAVNTHSERDSGY